MANGLPQTYNQTTGQWEDFTPTPAAPPSSVTPYQPGQGTGPGNPTLVTETPNYPTPAPTPAILPTSSVASATPVAPQTASIASVGNTTPAPTTPYMTNAITAATTAQGTSSSSTSQSLGTAYNNYFNNTSGTAPNTSPTADINQSIQPAQSSDPVFSSLVNSMAPILSSLNQVISDINNPQITGQSLQAEYQQVSQANNLPALQSELLNYQNIMNGTSDDIRDEVTSAGGFASESQVQALTVTRNNVLLKQYNALSSQYQAAQTNVSNIMQYATTDQQTAIQKEQVTSGIVQSMASIDAQVMNMGLTMQQNAVSAVEYNVSQTGYQALAASAQGNPQVLGYYEQLLNLAPGTLSNPTSLSQLDSYKQQQLAISQENAQNAGNRTIIYGEAQGYPLGGTTSTGTVTANGTTAPVTIDPNSLVRPSFVAANVPLSISSADMQSMIAGAPQGKITSGGTAGTNAYGNNITVNGVGNYVAQPDGSYILGSALPAAPASDVNSIISAVNSPGTTVPVMNYTDIKAVEAAAPPSSLSPTSTAFSKETLAVKRLLQYQVTSPVYTTVSQAPLPFARIQAAKNGNNSVSDTELLDSYITLAKGQGQITEAQISAITSASSLSDKLNIISQKVAGAGALISTDQRASLLALSGSVFDQYSQQYQSLYTSGINLLAQNHIAPSFWGTLPDFTQMFSGADISSTQLENPGI